MQAERFKEKTKNSVVTDLDAIIESVGSVLLHGKEHEIQPVLVGEFFAFANALAKVKELEGRDKVTVDEIIDTYYGLTFPVCPTITKDDIRRCSHSQIAALMHMIHERVTGKLTDEKKKMMMQNPGAPN